MTTFATATTFGPKAGIQGNSFAPQEKSTRQIVREEIQRQKKLDELEAKYQNGEISKLDYTVQKALITMPAILDQPTICTLDRIA